LIGAAGAVAVIEVSLLIVYAADRVPKCTEVAPVKPVPVILTMVPPEYGPDVGEMLVITGGTYVNWSADEVADVPSGVVTVISTVPRFDADGLVAVIEVSLLNVNDDAADWPNITAVTPVKPLPVMVTTVPPVFGPVVGETLVITGCDCV